MQDLTRNLEAAAERVRQGATEHPQIAIVLGSGLGPLADEVADARAVPYQEIPHFPLSTAPGHAGKLVLGRLEGQPVVVMAGRVHMYEGYSGHEVAFGVRLMRHLGAETLIITNAAGGVNTSFSSGTLMLISDHINLTGRNPLIGPNDPRYGPRFPDMSDAYNAELRALAQRVASAQGLPVTEGIYLGLLGPNYETPAEIRMFRQLGADAVGMSTVMEVIAANQLGMRVLGISCITNMAAGILPQKLTEEEVLETAQRVHHEFALLVRGIVKEC
jgi:purine-nucleoside phosphorylase